MFKNGLLANELIRTCSNASVAHAAIASIGCPLKDRIDLLAQVYGLERGSYTARLVRQFADEAAASEWANLERAMFQQDMPLLAGLRFIIETSLDHEALLDQPLNQSAASVRQAAQAPGALRRSQGRDPSALSRPSAA